MRLLILGAAGFIGSHLVRHAEAQGYEVVALCRSGVLKDFEGRTHKWCLGMPVPATAIEGVNCAIHLAHDFGGDAGAKLTREGTLASVEQLRSAGVPRQLFFSSYSAGPHATSIYGRTKLAIEHQLKKTPNVTIVRPGLVMGNGGLYGRIQTWAQRLPLIPLPDGGRGKVPVITIESLCRETLALLTSCPPPIEANLFEGRLRSLRELVMDVAARSNRHPLILPVPAILVIASLRAASFLKLPLPVNADNLTGFLANQQAMHISSIRKENA